MRTDENGCLVWNYQPQPDDREYPPAEFSWKARTTIDLPLFFATNDLVFTPADLQQIAKTFAVNIYRPGGEIWNAHITSDFRDPATIVDYNGGILPLSAFIQLADHQPQILEMVEDAIANRPADGGWLHRSHGIAAYAYRLKRPMDKK